jgi:tRNA (mo5U34)-methyltransferase
VTRSPEASDPFRHVRDWHGQLAETGWWHSYELPDGSLISGVSSVADQQKRIAQFPIPADLTGKRVLDIGTWDGWFAMEMEKRGAEVVAIDRWDNPRFHQIRRMLNSRAEYILMSVYDLDPVKLGHFDVVLFMGVLYHLKHPLLALEKVASVTKGMAAVESFVLRERHRPGMGIEQYPMMEFFEGEDFGGELDNWLAPTVSCLSALCRTAGFVRVAVENVQEFGAALTCHRTWAALPEAAQRPHPNLKLVSAFDNDTRGVNFRAASSDDYVGCRLSGDEAALGRDSVWPEVGEFASTPVFVGMVEGQQWQVNFKLPPGLTPGWHPVRIRTPEGVTNDYAIAVDVPCVASELAIKSAADAISWQPLSLSCSNQSIAIWVSGLPRNADLNTVKVRIADRLMLTTFVGQPGADGNCQVNAKLLYPEDPGRAPLLVAVGEVTSDPVEIEITA